MPTIEIPVTRQPALPIVSPTGAYGFSGNYTVADALPNSALFSVQDYAKPVLWSATGLPDGVVINPQTGILTGKLMMAGDYNATISATNSTGTGTYSQRFTVIPTQNVPVVTLAAVQPGGTSQGGYGQQALQFAVGAPVEIYFDATENPASWAAADFPLGLTIDAQTGTVSGVIRVPGNYRFWITASNGVGPSDPLGVTVQTTGETQAFQFVTDDPTLSDLQIDTRTCAAVFGRQTPFKYGETVRMPLIWLDFSQAVNPPDVPSVKLGFRPKDTLNKAVVQGKRMEG
jgi:hypothetical protein